MASSFIVKRFQADRYTAIFSPNTGFFARVEDVGQNEPFWAHHGPELLDVAITNWCDKGCSFCYRKSDQSGTSLSLEDYEEIMRQAKEMHVFQVALGGGNPNQHPQFCDILRTTREEYGIIPNYTSNGRGLTPEILEATKKYCGAVAISAYPPYDETSHALKALQAYGIKTTVHFMLTCKSVNTAIEWLSNPPPLLIGVHAIVFLNYKPVGRFADEKLLLNRSPRLAEFFSLATMKRYPFRVGFDTCTITGLARLGRAAPVSLEGCDAGRFSMFVSERMEAYPCSFMVEAGYQGISLRNTRLIDIWRDNAAFQQIRSKHAGGGCADCTTRDFCLSGCPLFPQMNLCPSKCTQPQDGDTCSVNTNNGFR